MTTEQRIYNVKVCVFELAKNSGTFPKACLLMGDSQDSFYRFKEPNVTAARRVQTLLLAVHDKENLEIAQRLKIGRVK